MKNLTIKIVLLVVLLTVLFSSISLAENDSATVERYMNAMQAVYQPEATAKQIDALFAFMADDVTDYHAAYGVTLTGTEKKRIGLQQKIKNSISYQLDIESIIMGTDTAIIEYKEDAKYIK